LSARFAGENKDGSMSAKSPQAYIPESGMPEAHFRVFQEVAAQENLVILVRNTNVASMKLIELGCPGKPMQLGFVHTSDATGVVTAQNPGEIKRARDLGYFVVDADSVPRGNFQQNGREVLTELTPAQLKFRNPAWRIQPGQIIDPKQFKPVVGDYDIQGAFDPRNPGQNIALVASEGELLADVMGPTVKRVASAANARLDQPRVMHGANDQYKGFRGGVTVFYPGGTTLLLPDEEAVEIFYDAVGRQTRIGRYSPRLAPTIPTVPGSALLEVEPKGGLQGVLSNHDVMAALGMALGAAIQFVGDLGTQRRIRSELETRYAAEIQRILSQGDGVLIIIVMQEWIIPDFNGMRARGLLDVCIQRGPNQTAALQSWQQPKYLKGPPEGWRAYEQYVWIDPKS
jgi:hypothetical protein